MEKLLIDLAENSYEIHVGAGLLERVHEYLDPVDKLVLITDENVDELYGKALLKSLADREVYTISFTPGEERKNLQTVEKILDQMLELGLTRRSKIIALGGGVVGDIAGFCAAVYMRGIPFIQVPTTLLAQVDSSVGGKTGVNLTQGKNTAGSFYQPEAVIIDTNTLHTLAKRELISGLAEVIKYGIIYDYDFFQYLAIHFDQILNLNENVIKEVVKKCCLIKASVVAEDEKEKGLRKILNHGHTIGHALEISTEYGKYTHGEAVLIGMYYEAMLARKLGFIDEEYLQEIVALLQRPQFPLELSGKIWFKLPASMLKDKKNIDYQISFILPSGRGKVKEILLSQEEVIDNISKIL